MIRTTSHSLKFITDFKKSKLDNLFSEYQLVTNKFVNLFGMRRNYHLTKQRSVETS